jgi:hypothetical protein
MPISEISIANWLGYCAKHIDLEDVLIHVGIIREAPKDSPFPNIKYVLAHYDDGENKDGAEYSCLDPSQILTMGGTAYPTIIMPRVVNGSFYTGKEEKEVLRQLRQQQEMLNILEGSEPQRRP